MKKLEPLCIAGRGVKMVQPLWKTVWQFLKKPLKLPYDPAIILLSTYPKELKAGSRRNTCIPVFRALFTTVQTWKQHSVHPQRNV